MRWSRGDLVLGFGLLGFGVDWQSGTGYHTRGVGRKNSQPTEKWADSSHGRTQDLSVERRPVLGSTWDPVLAAGRLQTVAGTPSLMHRDPRLPDLRSRSRRVFPAGHIHRAG